MGSSAGPIHSRLDDDPSYAEALDAFVIALAERVDELQDIEVTGNLALLAGRAEALGGEAARLGYPALERSAQEVRSAALEGNGELACKTLIALTDVARRIRQGHRGSL